MEKRVRESLLGTGLPYARDTAERVSAVLDGYAERWVRQRTALFPQLAKASQWLATHGSP